jgi:hypothetical protein
VRGAYIFRYNSDDPDRVRKPLIINQPNLPHTNFQELFFNGSADAPAFSDTDTIIPQPNDEWEDLAAFFEFAFLRTLEDLQKATQEENSNQKKVIQVAFKRLETMLRDDQTRVDMNDSNFFADQVGRDNEIISFLFAGFSLSVRLFGAMGRTSEALSGQKWEDLNAEDQHELIKMIEKSYNLPSALANHHLQIFPPTFQQLIDDVPGLQLSLNKNEIHKEDKPRVGNSLQMSDQIKQMKVITELYTVATGCPALPTKVIKDLFDVYFKVVRTERGLPTR